MKIHTAIWLTGAIVAASSLAPLGRAEASGGRDGSTTTSSTSTTTPATTIASATTIAPHLPAQVTPVKLYSTSNSQSAALAADGDDSTEFVTQMAKSSPPTWAWLNADLGESVPLVRIDWMWSAPSAADQFRIDISSDGITWTTLATPGESPVGSWNTMQLKASAEIVRFAFRNPNHDPQLGHLAEVRFFAADGFVRSDQPHALSTSEMISRSEIAAKPAAGATLVGRRYKVKGSSRSSNSPEGSSRLALDGKADTAWQTDMIVPPRTGWTAYDLGDTVKVGEVRWKFSKVEFADKFVVESSPDGVHWTTFAKASNPPAADTWVSMTTNLQTRFVRFRFSNPNKDANIGYLSEVRFYATP